MGILRSSSQRCDSIGARPRTCRDPYEDEFLWVARDGRAVMLVTGDPDLLVLRPMWAAVAIVTVVEAKHLAAVGPSALRWQGGHPVSRSVLFVLRDRRSRKLKRTIPRWVWALPLGLGLAASVLSPIVWNMQHGVEGVLTEADEASLSCSVEAACGALRGPVTLLQVTVPELLPDDVQPPGYADCAARHVGTAFGPEIRLTPCKSPAR